MRVPPFRRRASGTPGVPPLDGLSRHGAEELARRIAAAWAERGHTVTPVVLSMGTGWGWVVRLPDLIGGLPATSIRNPGA